MDDQRDEIMRLLADPTRLKIYRSVLRAADKPVSANAIASRFKLHPNVARMHLEKLAGTGLLKSRHRTSGKGGRPAREYMMGSNVVSASFPQREYQLLADITITAIERGEDIETTARKKGREIGSQALSKAGLSNASGPGKLVRNLKKLAGKQGLYADFKKNGDKCLDVIIHNCIFKELSIQHAVLICQLHQQLFIGICESHFSKVTFSGQSEIAKGGSSCLFSVILS